MNPSGAEGGDPKTPPQQINFLEEAAARRGAAVGHRAGPDSIGEKNRRENSDEKKINNLRESVPPFQIGLSSDFDQDFREDFVPN